MKLINSTVLVAMLILNISTEILAVPVFQNQNAEDKKTLSNPDAEKTPILVDSAMTAELATLYYPWNAIKILHKGNGVPKISFTASPKGVFVTATVSLDVQWLKLRDSVEDFKQRHPDLQKVNLVPIHPEKGQYAFALRFAEGEDEGKRQYFPKSRVDNAIPTNQVVVSLALAGNEASDFIDALTNGAIMEIHYKYQFSVSAKLEREREREREPVIVHSKIELNGYCETFPGLFNYQYEYELNRGQFDQGCLPGMEVSSLQETLMPVPRMAGDDEKVENSSDELTRFCLMFPDEPKCPKIVASPEEVQQVSEEDTEEMMEICENIDPESLKCLMWKKITQAFAVCFFDSECRSFEIGISE